MHWVPHAIACIWGTYVVCSSMISIMLRNLTTHRWNQATCGGMHWYVSRISSLLWWFFPLQLRWRPLGATIVPLYGSPDQTHLTNYSGEKKEWLVHLSLGHIHLTIRSKPSNLPNILDSLLPIPSKYHIKERETSTTVNKHQIHNAEDLGKVLDLIFHPLNVLFNSGKLMLYLDGR